MAAVLSEGVASGISTTAGASVYGVDDVATDMVFDAAGALVLVSWGAARSGDSSASSAGGLALD